MKKLKNTTRACLGATFLWSLLVGCSDDEGSGSLTVLLEPEDVIRLGLEPGDDTENIQDGWTVAFDKYIVAVGDIDVHSSQDESVEAEAADVFVVDLVELPPTGLELWTLDGLQEGRWEFNYATLGASDGASRDDSVAADDFEHMNDEDWTYLVDGSIDKEGGQSCPPVALAEPGDAAPNGNTSGDDPCYDVDTVRFEFGANAETLYGPCEVDEVPGFAVTAGGSSTVAITIHGDHLFFNGFPEGSEGGVMRLAQWLADCDLNLDGTVTEEELRAINPADLPEIDDRFQLGGSPISPIDNMYTYVVAQLKSQGHFQGEGECPVDGVAHEHGEDEQDHDDPEHDEGDHEDAG